MAFSWAQDVFRCHLCETPVPLMYCDVCNIHLCNSCVGLHLSDGTTKHRIVLFKNRGLTPRCSKHSTQLCDLYCEHCDIPFCLDCVSSGEHFGHKQASISKVREIKKNALKRDLKELKKNHPS